MKWIDVSKIKKGEFFLYLIGFINHSNIVKSFYLYTNRNRYLESKKTSVNT